MNSMGMSAPSTFSCYRSSDVVVPAFTARGGSSWIDQLMVSSSVDVEPRSYSVWEDFDMFAKDEDHWPVCIGVTLSNGVSGGVL